MTFSRFYDVLSCIYTYTVWNLNNYKENQLKLQGLGYMFVDETR